MIQQTLLTMLFGDETLRRARRHIHPDLNRVPARLEA